MVEKIKKEMRVKRLIDFYAKRNRLISEKDYRDLKKKTVCQICEKHFHNKKGQIHHKIPVRLGGKNTRDNLMIVCKACHDKIHENDRRDLNAQEHCKSD